MRWVCEVSLLVLGKRIGRKGVCFLMGRVSILERGVVSLFGWMSVVGLCILCVNCSIDYLGWCQIRSELLKIVMFGWLTICLGPKLELENKLKMRAIL